MEPVTFSRRSLLIGNRVESSDAAEASSDESGATAVEYGLLAALLAIIMIPAIRRLGRRTRRPLNCTKNTMRRARRGRGLPGCAS